MDIGIDYGKGDYSSVVFGKVDDGGVAVIIGSLTGEPADAFIALLRVARAAKTVASQVGLAREPNKPLGQSPIDTKGLLEALKEVEDLL